ncbi:MAG: hypothetical protein LAO77_07240 [Acidobacteriia bacterium]|nr:hypothetical protein [Terriglobia bacterium]
MAFLRFSRDKRGYEHFALVQPTTNRRGTTRQRVLYLYRTPPDIKVGREPFDEAVRRALETQYPDISFDWRKILETPIPSADAERWRERRRAERAARQAASAETAAEEAEASAPAVPEDLDLPTLPQEPAGGETLAGREAAGQAVPTSAGPGAPAPAGDAARRRRRRRRGRRGRPEGAVATSATTPSGPASEAGGATPDPGHVAEAEEPHEPESTDTESAGE